MAAGTLLLAAIIAAAAWWHLDKPNRTLLSKLQARANPSPAPSVDCLKAPGQQVVLLVLGQSNAGNHGAETEPQARGEGPWVNVFDGSTCRRSADPLPGGTGRHRSIWTRLEPLLRQRGVQAELLVAMLAVDSSTIDDWTRDSSPLKAELQQLLHGLSRASLKPDAVLWQHGESDARHGTSTQAYEHGFARLLGALRSAGVQAPVLIARSTRCRNAAPEAIRSAQGHLVGRHDGVLAGPDTDTLSGIFRVNDCHWSRIGLDAAAEAWAATLAEPLLRR
jgi:hypothetical protein